MPHKAAHHPRKCDVIYAVKLFSIVYTGYSVANFLHYPIRRPVTKSSALECIIHCFAMYTKCSKIWNTFLFLFLKEMLIIITGIHKMHARIANKEDPNQTASSEHLSCMFFHCLFKIAKDYFYHLLSVGQFLCK